MVLRSLLILQLFLLIGCRATKVQTDSSLSAVNLKAEHSLFKNDFYCDGRKKGADDGKDLVTFSAQTREVTMRGELPARFCDNPTKSPNCYYFRKDGDSFVTQGWFWHRTYLNVRSIWELFLKEDGKPNAAGQAVFSGVLRTSSVSDIDGGDIGDDAEILVKCRATK